MGKELFIPTNITRVDTLDPGELRKVQLTLPEEISVNGGTYPLRDQMRPGTAFLTKPFGQRTQKIRRRMYTRSNTSQNAEFCLETVINYTHLDKSDTSIWWQSEDVLSRPQEGDSIDVRVDWNEEHSTFDVYENTQVCQPNNLRLEPDSEWEGMKFVGVAFATGITPFLSYLKYMETHQFGRSESNVGTHFTLIASARIQNQLIEHHELLKLEQEFPENFRYHPVLTREWPEDWPYTKGRIIRSKEIDAQSSEIDLSPMLTVVSNLDHSHLRMCGNRQARDQLQHGLDQQGLLPISFRAEVW